MVYLFLILRVSGGKCSKMHHPDGLIGGCAVKMSQKQHIEKHLANCYCRFLLF